VVAEEAPAAVIEEPAPAAKPARKQRGKAAAAEAASVSVPAANNDAAEPQDSDEPRRSGWWQRTFG
jgi:ribonuclease E